MTRAADRCGKNCRHGCRARFVAGERNAIVPGTLALPPRVLSVTTTLRCAKGLRLTMFSPARGDASRKRTSALTCQTLAEAEGKFSLLNSRVAKTLASLLS